MSDNGNAEATVVRTDRGLTLRGTRLTVYTLMDYLKDGWPPHLVQQVFELSDAQMQAVLDYIDEHREEVEAEYQEVIEEADERRRYWEGRNRGLLEEIRTLSLDPEKARVRDKVQALRRRGVDE